MWKKVLNAHTLGHSVFDVNKLFSITFTTPLTEYALSYPGKQV